MKNYQLKPNIEQLHRLVENNADGILVIDEDGVIQFANPAAGRILGHRAENLLGKSFGFPISPALEREIEIDVVRPDGARRLVEMRVAETEWANAPAHIASLRDVTERRKSEARIQFQAQLLDVVDQAIIAADLEGAIIYWNRFAEQLYGWTASEALGRDLVETIVSEDAQNLLTHLMDRLSGDVRWSGEIAVQRRDGDPFTALVTNAPIHDADGNLTGVVIVSFDISDRKRSEEALQRALSDTRQREREVSALLEGARAVMAYHDFETTARTIFDICRNLIGAISGYVALLSEDGAENELLFLEAGGLPCTVNPELPMPIRGLRESAYRTGEAVYHNDFSNSRWVDLMPAGHVRLDNVLFATLVSEGRTIGLIGLANKPAPFTEVDAQIAKAFGDLAAIALINSRTLDSLEESREKFRSVVEQSDDGIVLADDSGRVIEWNQGAERIFGLPGDAVLGRALWDVQFQVAPADRRTPDLHREMEAMLRQMFQTRQVLDHRPYDTEIERPDGERRIIQSVIFPVEVEQGFMIGSVIRDVTEQKRVERQIQAALHEKEILLKEIHHRVKNNLAIVAGLLEFQSMTVEDEQAREAFLESQNRIYTMAHIHEHLYRSDDLAQIDMVDYLFNLMDHLGQSYGAYGIEMDVQAEDVALPVDVAIPCGLIVNELVSNALQHAFPPDRPDPGQDQVSVELYEREGELTLKVRDNGVGLPPDFDRRNLTSLGVKLTDMLSKQLGGEATHHSEGGAIFTVTFPTPTAKEKAKEKEKEIA